MNAIVFPEIVRAQAGGGADPAVGGGMLDGRGGVLAGHLPAGVPGRAFWAPATPGPDLRIGRQREGDREGARRPVPRRRHARRERRAAQTLFHQGRRRLSNQQERARAVRVRPARPRPRPTVLEAGPGQLPQRPHLLRSAAAKAGPAHPSLLPEPARLPAARPHRDISGFSQLFSAVDKHAQDLRPHGGAQRAPVRAEDRGPPQRHRRASPEDEPTYPRRPVDVGKHLDRLLLARYAPAGVLVNEKMEILQFRGRDRRLPAARPGRAAEQPHQDGAERSALDAARDHRARRKPRRAPARTAGVEIDQDGFTRTCDLVVVPFTGLPDAKEPLFVVLFEEVQRVRAKSASTRPAKRKTVETSPTTSPDRARADGDQGVPAAPSSRSMTGPTTTSAPPTRSWSRATKSSRA